MQTKIVSPSHLAALVQSLRRQKKSIVFTNGTFDYLHAGHVMYLQKAKKLGDVLFVGLNSDASVKSYKGPKRPINHQKDRAFVLAALECVSYITIFNSPTPIGLIHRIKPDILVKGNDWKVEQIAGAKEVLSWGGKVKLIPLLKGRSSTRIINALHG